MRYMEKIEKEVRNMEKYKRALVIIAVLIYLVSPIDLVPGCPIDDIILIVLTVIKNRESVIETRGMY